MISYGVNEYSIHDFLCGNIFLVFDYGRDIQYFEQCLLKLGYNLPIGLTQYNQDIDSRWQISHLYYSVEHGVLEHCELYGVKFLPKPAVPVYHILNQYIREIGVEHATSNYVQQKHDTDNLHTVKQLKFRKSDVEYTVSDYAQDIPGADDNIDNLPIMKQLKARKIVILKDAGE